MEAQWDAITFQEGRMSRWAALDSSDSGVPFCRLPNSLLREALVPLGHQETEAGAGQADAVQEPEYPPDHLKEEGVDHGGSGSEESGCEACGIERPQVVDRFSHADEPDGDVGFLRDREDHPSLGGPVQLGENDARYAGELPEGLCLSDRVPAVGRVENEEHLLRSALDFPPDDAHDLAP